MARIRSIHPSFFTDEAVLSCSMAARMLYVGLWTEADCQGIFEWRPVQLKVRLLPMDVVVMADLLDELVAADLIRGFDDAGQKYGAIREFRHFQRPKKPYCAHPLPDRFRKYVAIDARSPEPDGDEERPVGERPQPQLSLVHQQYPTSTPPVDHQGGKPPAVEGRVGVGVGEGEGLGGETPPRKRGARLPNDWELTPELIAYGVDLGFQHAKVLSIAERFKLHWHSSSNRNAVKLDWGKAFQGWLRDDAEKLGVGKHTAPGQKRPAAYGPEVW